jgi:phage baseplate assembly protein W
MARFGTDLRLIAAGDGELDLVADGRGDLAVTGDSEQVEQALTLRLLVRRGELAGLGWPDVGSRLHELIGEPDVPRTRLRLAAYVREALADDPRVAAVAAVDVVTDQVEARVQAQVVLTDDTSVGVSVAVPLEAP